MTDEEFLELIDEAMERQAARHLDRDAVDYVHTFRNARQCKYFGLYIGLFTIKISPCLLCRAQDSNCEGCESCEDWQEEKVHSFAGTPVSWNSFIDLRWYAKEVEGLGSPA